MKKADQAPAVQLVEEFNQEVSNIMKGVKLTALGKETLPNVIDVYSQSVNEENFEDHLETVTNVINAYKADEAGNKVREIASGLYQEDMISVPNLKEITKDSRYLTVITAYIPQTITTKSEADEFTKHVVRNAANALKFCHQVKYRVEVK